MLEKLWTNIFIISSGLCLTLIFCITPNMLSEWSDKKKYIFFFLIICVFVIWHISLVMC